MDGYRQLFVEGPTARFLSRSRPVRRQGYDLDLVVCAAAQESDDVVSLRLTRPDGLQLPEWRPGAHIDLFLPSGRQRQYSLCGDPRDRTSYRIAVRRIAEGGGGSIEAHELRFGDRVRVRGPRNAFAFVDAPSYLFIAGGIGITPILPMVKAAGSKGHLVYVGRSRKSMPFLDELPSSAEIRPDDEFGVPDVADLISRAQPGAAVYVCGPPPVLDAAQRLMFTLNPTGSLHTERFSAAPVVDGREFTATLARSGTEVRVGADETALAAIRRVQPGVVYSCQQGFCGTCKVRVLGGEVDHRRNTIPEHMLTCVSRAFGDSIVLDL
ncbi:MAG: PDR/VanB family oxidoreductase [Nocardiaceae bacterium]|nr:PDR/VanB family oxidoreductase [Nocardiaceae bacterium]